MSKSRLKKIDSHLPTLPLVLLMLAACTPATDPLTSISPSPSVPSRPPVSPQPSQALLPARSLRLKFQIDPRLLKGFGLKQTTDIPGCQQTLNAVQTLLTVPGSLSSEAIANLTNAGVQVQDQGGQTLLTLNNTVQQLAQDTLGLDYTLNDLPVGTTTGQTLFRDSQGGELGYVDYTISVSGQSGSAVTIQLQSTGSPATLTPCPQVAATVTGATLTATGGDISAAPAATPPPTTNPPVITSLSALSGAALSSLTLTGSGFTGATAVRFAGIQAIAFSVDSDTQITATVPGGFNSGVLTVVTPGGTATSGDSFTLQAYSGPPRTLYVKQNAASGGNGSSWSSAFTHPNEALAVAQSGDQIWIAQGLYLPSTSGDRTQSFRLVPGVSVYGGFAGTETAITERSIEQHETVLSGDLARNDNYSDANFEDVEENSYHVVIGANNALLDGVTIAGGNAAGAAPDDRGGGILNLGTSPSLDRVRFLEDRADYLGGGIYNSGGAAPQISNFSFNGCFARHAGGAVYNASGTAPAFSQGLIAFNSSKHGGGVFNDRSSPTFSQVDFTSNTAQYFGGGMANRNGASPILNQGQFLNNRASIGGGLYNTDGSSPVISNYTFTVNKADNGAGIYAYNNSILNLQQSVFKGNVARYFGGGIYLYKASAGIPQLNRLVFVDNTAKDGAGLAIRSESAPVITNSLLINNYASASGGGLYVSSLAAPVLRQVTLYKNIAANGADIFTTIFSQTSVFSSIIWNPTRGKPARSYNSSQLNINNSVVSDLTGISGAGNLNTDPYFVNPVDFDGADNLFMTADDGLRLSETSPALTAGLAAGMPMVDILGVPRTAPPDMGAYQGGFVAELAPLVIEDLVVGSGATATLGNKITVHYTGQLIDGTVFDSSYDRGEPFSLTLGTSQVIPGWEQGLQGMKVGGRRKLTIPSYLAYGSSAVGIIPPDSTLVFEVELVSIP